jgi:hypothetical protein
MFPCVCVCVCYDDFEPLHARQTATYYVLASAELCFPHATLSYRAGFLISYVTIITVIRLIRVIVLVDFESDTNFPRIAFRTKIPCVYVTEVKHAHYTYSRTVITCCRIGNRPTRKMFYRAGKSDIEKPLCAPRVEHLIIVLCDYNKHYEEKTRGRTVALCLYFLFPSNYVAY